MSALLNYNVCIYIVYMYIYTLYVSIVFQLPQHGLYFHLIDKYMKICVSYNLLIFLLVMLNLIQLFYKHLNIYLLDRAPSGLPHSFSHFPILVSVHVVNQMKSNSTGTGARVQQICLLHYSVIESMFCFTNKNFLMIMCIV